MGAAARNGSAGILIADLSMSGSRDWISRSIARSFFVGVGVMGAGCETGTCGIAGAGALSTGVTILVPHLLQNAESSGTRFPHRIQNVPNDNWDATGGWGDGEEISGLAVPVGMLSCSVFTGRGDTTGEFTISIFGDDAPVFFWGAGSRPGIALRIACPNVEGL